MNNEVVLLVYTTEYKKGGDKFRRVAKTLAKDKSIESNKIIVEAIESKKALIDLFNQIAAEGDEIEEFHFIGHSGMYGPMFGTVQFPEQFSPFEIKNLKIPFSENGKAFFRCCRSARWVAPYFAQQHKIKTFGYHWYTSFSTDPNYYKPDFSKNEDKPLYCFGCKGRKSHGYITSIKKWAGFVKAEKLKEFNAIQESIDRKYNKVADLYNDVFTDISVRKDELKWIKNSLNDFPDKVKVLDIGCGNGALLRNLSGRINEGVGVDISESLINLAKKSSEDYENLHFSKIDGPFLPFEDNSFDAVVSLLSFRYLDWDPILQETERILKKDGKLIIVDMVTKPLSFSEYPKFIISKIKAIQQQIENPNYFKKLKKLVSDPNWKEMLKYNPIRAEHEMKWYLESRFPGREVKVINYGFHARILAFESGNMKNLKKVNLQYP